MVLWNNSVHEDDKQKDRIIIVIISPRFYIDQYAEFFMPDRSCSSGGSLALNYDETSMQY